MAVKVEKTPAIRTITVAHSPDSDDAFMFYGLATNKLETDGLKFEHTLKDIQSLNEDARKGVFDVTAISFHAYAYVSDKYALLPHGASIGDNYGPILVAKEPREASEIGTMKIAVPGELTSGYLALRIFNLLHYGHNSQVNALCLLLLAVAVAPLVVWAVARWAAQRIE